MDHSYEEIRAVAIEILAGREKILSGSHQFSCLGGGVAEVFARREGTRVANGSVFAAAQTLSPIDEDTFLEVFWDLFRQGIITIGQNSSNPQFPFFRVSGMGQRILANQPPYFFHDVSTYTAIIRKEIPQIDEVTLLYLMEAMQAFQSGCVLSATVMLGVAAEHTFLLLIGDATSGPVNGPKFAAVEKERTILKKINKFNVALEQQQSGLPYPIRENLETNFSGIQSLIRNFRNNAGHPTGKIVGREQAYVLLHLSIPCHKKMYQLRSYFQSTSQAGGGTNSTIP